MNAECTSDIELRQQELDEELSSVLLAISVISKRLAMKINQGKKEVMKDEKTLQTDGLDCQN